MYSGCCSLGCVRKQLRTSGQGRYPVPAEYPKYISSVKKIPGEKHLSLADIFEAACVLVVLGLTLWLAWLVAQRSAHLAWGSLWWLVLFWALMAYVALPRLHQFFTRMYVPDYFIARTRTGDGLLGDPVNLALEGTAADIHAAMRAAGWIRADEVTIGSSLGIIWSSLLRRSYPEAPVSNLFLFGKRQAFAYQQEVAGNAAQRHHIRFWPVPEGWLLPGGHQVGWLAAATYDRAVGLSLFTGQITHKIDANIDVERDYVINTVRFTDPECTVELIEDFSTAYHGRNGGGDSVYTDGDLPVLDVTGSAGRFQEQEPAYEDRGSRKAKDHRLPPLPFLLIGVLVGFHLLLLPLVWFVLARGGALAQDQQLVADLVLHSGLAVVITILWVLSAAHHRWARIALMIIAVTGSFGALMDTTMLGDASSMGLVTAGISILMTWAISSEAMRYWVSPEAKRHKTGAGGLAS